VGKLVAAVYAQTMDVFLHEASDVEAEAEWWAEVERSRLRAAYYLLQSTYLCSVICECADQYRCSSASSSSGPCARSSNCPPLAA
jgi:hypothetical protein